MAHFYHSCSPHVLREHKVAVSVPVLCLSQWYEKSPFVFKTATFPFTFQTTSNSLVQWPGKIVLTKLRNDGFPASCQSNEAQPMASTLLLGMYKSNLPSLRWGHLVTRSSSTLLTPWFLPLASALPARARVESRSFSKMTATHLSLRLHQDLFQINEVKHKHTTFSRCCKRGKNTYSDFFFLRRLLSLSYQWTRTYAVG